MTDQMSFEDHVILSRAAPDTSVAAAKDHLPRSGTARRLVYEAIKASPRGMTDFELEASTGLQQNTLRPRRNELAAQGLIVDSGERRDNPLNHACIVWRAV